ncbi:MULTISPECIES: c-type cytochrome [Myroides]|uniref:c-type cytochrome n=1 Tax=Myroides TaxID=76831 RepID=UPI0013032FEE|nr:c-type cytochrome [Myroides phaeus]
MKTRNLFTLSFFLILSVALLAFTNDTEIKESNVTKSEWKNLKVLPQDISNDSLKSLMRGYNDALGVKCSHCHTAIEGTDKLDFADDSKKEKEIARKMILMTRKINADNFNWENHPNPELINVVNCTMCHRGNTKATKIIN